MGVNMHGLYIIWGQIFRRFRIWRFTVPIARWMAIHYEVITKLGLRVWIWMVYISFGSFFLGDSESERWCLWLGLQAPYAKCLGEGHVICFEQMIYDGAKFEGDMNLMRVVCTLTVALVIAKWSRALGRGSGTVEKDYLFTIGCEFQKGINMRGLPHIMLLPLQ